MSSVVALLFIEGLIVDVESSRSLSFRLLLARAPEPVGVGRLDGAFPLFLDAEVCCSSSRFSLSEEKEATGEGDSVPLVRPCLRSGCVEAGVGSR